MPFDKITASIAKLEAVAHNNTDALDKLEDAVIALQERHALSKDAQLQAALINMRNIIAEAADNSLRILQGKA